MWAGGSCWSGMRRNQSEIWRSGPSCHARGRPGSTRGPPVWPMADHPLKYPRNEGVVHEKPAPGLGETREETLPQTLKEVEVGRGLGQRPSWLARKPLIRRHTQPCRDDPPPTPHAAAAPWFRAARRHSPMGVEPLRAGAQRNLGRGPQRAIGAPSGDAAGPTEIRECSLSHPQILLQNRPEAYAGSLVSQGPTTTLISTGWPSVSAVAVEGTFSDSTLTWAWSSSEVERCIMGGYC